MEAVGGTVSLLLCNKVFLVNVTSDKDSIDIQWGDTWAISVFTVFLGLFFYYLPLPEASESDFQSRS